jgi:hypothetical protein
MPGMRAYIQGCRSPTSPRNEDRGRTRCRCPLVSDGSQTDAPTQFSISFNPDSASVSFHDSFAGWPFLIFQRHSSAVLSSSSRRDGTQTIPGEERADYLEHQPVHVYSLRFSSML